MATAAELNYNTSASAMQMAQTIFGDGVTVVGASYSGDSRSSAIYGNGDALSPGVVPADSGVILSTGYAASFTRSSGDPNTSGSTSTNTYGPNGNPMFNALVGAQTYDASILDVDFIPTGDVMTIRFVFSSEEYPEYANSVYNDTVGIWINGVNVPMSVGTGAIAVGNVNPNEASNLYVDNTGDAYNTEMDGFTLTMSVTIPVVAGQVNSLRVGIADVQDSNYDSNLLIAADSVQTTLVASDDSESLYPEGTRILDVLANDTNTTGGTLTITHINGVAVNAGDTVILPSGDAITLNADGTLTIVADDDADTFNFTYEVASSTGAVDTAIVTVETIPCFVAGTMIMTPGGEVPVETLRAGDVVITRDDGPQVLRWIGRRSVAAEGAFAPVRIKAGTFGDHRTLKVSPQHRILIRDRFAQLLFGEDEVLVAAKDLVNGATVRVAEGGIVEYVHLLFDRHQVVYSDGLATESYLPGPMTADSFDSAVSDEICALFPDLDPATGAGYSPAARRILRHFEARVLLNEGIAA